MVYIIDICNGIFDQISYYNNIYYKCEFKLLFFYSLYDTRNASSNNGKNDTILGLVKVYVVYLLETERGGRSYLR